MQYHHRVPSFKSQILASAYAVARAAVFDVLDELEIATVADDEFERLVEQLARKNKARASRHGRIPENWDEWPFDALWRRLNSKPRAQP